VCVAPPARGRTKVEMHGVGSVREVAALAPNCGCGVDQKSKDQNIAKARKRELWRTKDEFEVTYAADKP
jgi:hypothetical protein